MVTLPEITVLYVQEDPDDHSASERFVPQFPEASAYVPVILSSVAGELLVEASEYEAEPLIFTLILRVVEYVGTEVAIDEAPFPAQ